MCRPSTARAQPRRRIETIGGPGIGSIEVGSTEIGSTGIGSMDQGFFGIFGACARRTKASPTFGRGFFLPPAAAFSFMRDARSAPVRIASSPTGLPPSLLFSLKMSDKIKAPMAATVQAKKKLSIEFLVDRS
jgi:hypothetical protein